MPINADIQNDPSQCGYGLPVDCCVGDDGPAPTEVTTISKSGPKFSGVGNLRPSGGNPYLGGKSASPSYNNPPVGYDGP